MAYAKKRGLYHCIVQCKNHWLTNFFVGIAIGFMFVSYLRSFTYHREALSLCSQVRRTLEQELGSITGYSGYVYNSEVADTSEEKGLIFVGVMTAQQYLDSRAISVYDTWGKNVPGKILFFSSSFSHATNRLPLVPLPGVDDSYPPQKKSFLMLKYMHDHFLEKYEWFMRADDDLYVRTDRLEEFLHSINSSKPQFIGQAGIGNKKELGQLNLERNENFCMGGPGMILSRETLRLVAPHIRHCLKNLYSTHEDVEIGRCIREFAGIPCTWSYQMQQIFYHNVHGGDIFHNRLRTKEVHRAITLHPVKQPFLLYRLHHHFHRLKLQNLKFLALLLHREMLDMARLLNSSAGLSVDSVLYGNTSLLGISPQLNAFPPETDQDVPTWDFFSDSYYSADHINPKHRIEASQKIALGDILMEVMELINKHSKQRGRVIDFKDILYGYVRANPLFGVDYILDLLLTYRKYKGKKMTIPVRRHAYVHRSYSQLEIRELPDDSDTAVRGASVTKDVTASSRDVINFIVPLSGRTEVFRKFLLNFEATCLKSNEKVALFVVLFQDFNRDSLVQTKLMLEALKMRYPDYKLRLIEAAGPFSRAVALGFGARLFPPDALLFFIDVDIVVHPGALHRIRQNTILSKQVYFPIVFSQYDPKYSSGKSDLQDNFYLNEDRGYWRQFGYGIVSIYHSDLVAVGGFDTSIRGWGKEDIDFYTKVVHSNLTLFRAVDPGLVHVFHEIHCDPALETEQFQMCVGSKLNSLGSSKNFAEVFFSDMEYSSPNSQNTHH